VLRETVAVLLVLAACERKATPQSEPTRERPSTAVTTLPSQESASSSAKPSKAPRSNASLGKATVHLPSGLAPNEKVPLVVVLHAFGASSHRIEQSNDFTRLAEAKRFAWVAPDGPKDTAGRRFWNAGTTCCNFDDAAVDHVAALRALVTRTITEHPIDAKRVHLVGYSNGGFMAHRLACELGGVVAGIASIAGAGPKPDEPCTAAAGVRVLQIHGDADDIVSIRGGPLFRDSRYPSSISALKTVEDWAKRFECNPKPTDAGSLDFEAGLAGEETKISRFEGCKRGAVELWTVTGGSHYVGFHSPSHEAIWTFLSET
jgi:polyhydroxybutyrate depolymerase